MAAMRLPHRCRLLWKNTCSKVNLTNDVIINLPKSSCISRSSSICNGISERHMAKHLYPSDYISLKNTRYFCTNSSPKEAVTDPTKLTESELSQVCTNIKKELNTSKHNLNEISHYLFDGKGKAFRPMTVLLSAKACNYHSGLSTQVTQSQREVAMIAEMIHTASLIHDDVIDAADTRRGKAAVNEIWGQKNAILVGDFILSKSSALLARIGNKEVVIVISQAIDDLVRGEFMQLGSKEDENERFAHYLQKTYKKTASLIANSCKAVSILSGCNPAIVEITYQYGRNMGIAFQLVDDMLDYISSDTVMGKPTSTDLKLGLATSPVLFACQQYPELNALIMRRFSEPGDVEKARRLVAETDGIQQTRYLAQQYCNEAIKQISGLAESPARKALVTLTHKILNRIK
ncbi:all trans-polyprenyl-diphosphate synthase PDSS1-like [Saccoglossus kowalevskii]|uniref:Decaprenyl-diphosphate synthase subunit 1-like n=1 Tax=Saccoglossus kowalevskii TaxID=10224 RepID=A0ABM0GVB4_SACKO|nr:PREDICTED: decaprenyl-diphosphate synthase subunit 1-like [Saccoglossus kowalevskii]